MVNKIQNFNSQRSSVSNTSSIFNSNFWNFLGYFLMDEIITWRVLISLAIILLGIYIFKKNNTGLKTNE